MPSDDTPTRRVESDDYLTRKGLAAGRKVFGRYVLETELGAGGMGVVWRARDEELRDPVALKFLPEVVARDDAAVDELREETRKARHLTHPNIVRVHQFERDGASAAVSMELVEGLTLSQLRLQQPGKVFAVEKLAPLVAQLCTALDYAHQQAKVVHRDLKPANIMVTAEGVVKVTDFGIARSLSETSTRLTGKGGATSGTLPYMSPQQVLGRKPTVADDIYSLGAMLYELLTGKPPFHRGDPYSLTLQIRENAPLSLAEQRAELETKGAPIPPAWEETILACLAKEPERRPQSAGEVAARLGIDVAGFEEAETTVETSVVAPRAVVAEAARLGSPSAAPPPESGGGHQRLESGKSSREPLRAEAPRSLRRWLLAAAAAVILLGLGGYLFRPKGRAISPEELAAANPETPAGAEKLPKPQAGRAWTVPDLDLQMAYIRPGTFTMGSPNSEEGRSDSESPQTRVTLIKGYWLGKTEVTQGQWEALMGSNPSNFKGADRPVEQVSWTEAMEFCRELTQREGSAGRLPDAYAYTLPTEAQWEYACRAGTTGPFAGSGNLNAMGWCWSNSGGQTHSVAQKQPNAWGLYDMHGNVWEWCRDWYGDYPGGSVRDPTGPASGSHRVYRGGSWGGLPLRCRSAYRSLDPGIRGFGLGFRLALAPSL